MKCTICNKDMEVKGRDETTGREDEQSSGPPRRKRYDRTIYNCEDCDTWATREIPKNEQATPESGPLIEVKPEE